MNKKIKDLLDDELGFNDQIILTGAPGTGKTYNVREYVMDNTKEKKPGNKWEFVQFHPSYDYSDFVEGLKPVVLSGSGLADPTFVRMDGIFKKFCRHVVIENYKKIVNSSYDPYSTLAVKFDINDYYDKIEKINKKDDNEEDNNEDNEHNESSNGKNTHIALDTYYFVIDEINRADLSKVFGELMYVFEKRGSKYQVETQYKNLKTYYFASGKASMLQDDCFKNGFFIPQNIKIIGTMNDIDKSVEAFDFALRRRFNWINIYVEDILSDAFSSMFSSISVSDRVNLINKINKMNSKIANEGLKFGLNEDYQIGPAYFKNVDFKIMDKSLEEIFDNNIKPLLMEYTLGRNKIDIFIDNCKKELLK